MTPPKIFFVHLRRPDRANPKEQRNDPFYEFGSFGCTRCHSKNLMNPRNAAKLEGARLAFVQGGPLGSRLVLLTPPVTVTRRIDSCEAKWKPVDMPFKYTDAPILAYNGGVSDFPMIEQFARSAKCRTVESGLSSLLRSRTSPVCDAMAKEIVSVYTRKRAKATHSAIAVTYEETLPYNPRKIDRNRKETYNRLVKKLAVETQSRCNNPRRLQPDN